MKSEVAVSGRVIRGLPRTDIGAFLLTALAALKRARAYDFPVTEISVQFVDDETMRKLNKRFRKQNHTTDVLTFETEHTAIDGESPLGDIVISVEQAKRQARAEGHPLATEVRYLLLHGLIHALGFDHETDKGEMNRLEQKIRQRVGLD